MNYSDEQRLEILQRADNWRRWRSLDDERLCIECAQLLTGRNVVLTLGDGEEPLVSCPTPGCKSTPRDWFYHGVHEASATADLG